MHNRAMGQTVETSARPSMSRAAALISGIVLLALACGLGAFIFYESGVLPIDTWWNGILVDLASPIVTGFAIVMDFLGAGWFGVFVVPIVGAVLLLILRRPWSAVFFIAAEIVSAGTIQLLKHLFGRARPEEILVISDYGSFPSGHAANAATLATAAFVLFPRLWVLIVGAAWMLLMAFSRTAVHAHWLSDTVGGMLVGIGSVLLLAAIFAPLIEREGSLVRTPRTRSLAAQ